MVPGAITTRLNGCLPRAIAERRNQDCRQAVRSNRQFGWWKTQQKGPTDEHQD